MIEKQVIDKESFNYVRIVGLMIRLEWNDIEIEITVDFIFTLLSCHHM